MYFLPHYLMSDVLLNSLQITVIEELLINIILTNLSIPNSFLSHYHLLEIVWMHVYSARHQWQTVIFRKCTPKTQIHRKSNFFFTVPVLGICLLRQTPKITLLCFLMKIKTKALPRAANVTPSLPVVNISCSCDNQTHLASLFNPTYRGHVVAFSDSAPPRVVMSFLCGHATNVIVKKYIRRNIYMLRYCCKTTSNVPLNLFYCND